MDNFWSSCRAVLYQAQECLQQEHTYSEDIQLHKDRIKNTLSRLEEAFTSYSTEDQARIRQWRTILESLEKEFVELSSKMETNPPPGRSQHLTVESSVTIDPTSSHPFNDPQLGLGRPTIQIDLQQVLQLQQAGYKKKEIAEMAGVSLPTLRKRMQDIENLKLDDQQIDVLVEKEIERFPAAGVRIVRGNLRGEGYLQTRQQIRSSMFRVDPEGLLDLSRVSIPRRVRTYYVPHPNALWHFDGYEKLRRWEMWIHGAIDGYSRRIMWLRCADNKDDDTVLSFFEAATGTGHGHASPYSFGVPLRVRCDKGGENVKVATAMHLLHTQTRPHRPLRPQHPHRKAMA
ncbi:hypothetical protein TWF481_002997 [Arthrobotrys musiformis]|uniref:Integrase catalytic domain-containing protein n=1 Tax=Arthrobotrys musiformis TaxID=47236 RepID=A0AAV9VUR6_9PEZI